MPIWLHIPLAILIVVYFLYRFIKDKQFYELLFVIWVPLTLLQYVSSNPTFIKVIGIVQVIMFILVIFFMFRRRGYNRHKTAEILAEYSTSNLDGTIDSSNERINSQDTQEENKEDSSL